MVSVPDCLERISAVLQLLGQLENSGPPPASEIVITELPRIPVTQNDIDLGRDCSVCMEALQLNEEVTKLPCRHFFHVSCIKPWLEMHNTCPICRKVVEAPSCGSSSRTYNNHLVDAVPTLFDQQQNSTSIQHHNAR